MAESSVRALRILARSFASRPAHCAAKAVGIAVEGVAALDHLDARGDVGRRGDVDREAEAVEQLRPQLALFRIAAADQHEARGVADAQALALDDVDARRRNVEQQVDQMVLQQVDLVDVEKAAMGAGQQAGLEGLLAGDQRLFQIERAGDAILGRAERQVDHRHRDLPRLEPARPRACSAQRAQKRAGSAGSQL